MGFFKGINTNIRGLMMGLKTPKLLMLGLLRFAVVVGLSLILAGLVLARHSEIFSLLWTKPESAWIVWAWYLASWLLTLLLIGLSAILSYLLAQVVFSVVIMDLMSRITEQMVAGHVTTGPKMSWLKQAGFLVKQELPRSIFPVLLMLVVMVAGWLTPAGPVLTILASVIATVFLAWDNTDLVPARRLEPFKQRFGRLMKSLPFHLGFGILFLIPFLNILLLSFAPVGAALYHVESQPSNP